MAETRDYAGAAVETTITGTITPTDLAITIADGSGWPTGAAGKFWIAIGDNGGAEEKVLALSRTGTTITVASTGDRGGDDTTAATHVAGTRVRHVFTATDAREVNAAAVAVDDKADTSHEHDADYAVIAHTHEYSATGHTHTYLPLTGGSLTGTVNMQDNAVTRPRLLDTAYTLQTSASVSGAVTLDYSVAQAFDLALVGDTTISVTNPPASHVGRFFLNIRQPAPGHTVTWPASFRWKDNTEPTFDPGQFHQFVLTWWPGFAAWHVHFEGWFK